MTSRAAPLGALVLLLPLWLAAPAAPRAATFTVTKTADTSDGTCDGSDCSLREAVIAANAAPNTPDPMDDSDEPPVQRDVIELPAGTYTLTLGGTGEDAAATGDLDVTESVLILPADENDDASTVRIEGDCAAGADDRLFHVLPLADDDALQVTILNVTLACGGDAGAFDADGGAVLAEDALDLVGVVLEDNQVDAGNGGAIAVVGDGNLRLFQSTVADNTAGGSGGALFTEGQVEIEDTLFRDNQAATGHGGALAVAPDGVLQLQRAALLDNTAVAGHGGAVANEGNLSLGNATFTGNSAGGNGGALYNAAVEPDGPPLLTNVTVSGNSAAGLGDGLFHEGTGDDSDVQFRSSVFTDACALGAASAFTSVGGNVESPGDTCGFVQDDDAPMQPGSPLLEALDATEALPVFPLTPDPMNPAIDGGVNSGCFLQDQRNRPRPVDGDFDGSLDCDSGAYEAQIPLAEKSDALLIDGDGDGDADEGDTILYTIVFENEGETTFDGPFDFSDVPVDATIVPGSEATTSGTITIEDVLDDEGQVVGTRIALTGATFPATVEFQATVDAGLPSSVTFVSNQGEVTLLADDPDDDPDMGLVPLTTFLTDDPDTPTVFGDPTLTPIADPPALVFTKRDELLPEGDVLGDGIVNPGDRVRYTLVLENTGDRAAVGLVLEDEIHRDGALVPGSFTIDDPGALAEPATLTAERVRLDLEPLAGGDSLTVTFDVMVDDPILLGCTDFDNQATLTGENVLARLSDDPDTGAESDPTETEISFGPLADLDTRLKIKLDFDEVGNDKAKLKVKEIPLPVDSPGGTEVIVDLGGVLVAGTLDGSGRFESDGGTTRVRLKGKDGEFKLLVKLKKAELAAALALIGFEDADVDKEPTSLPVQIAIGAESFRASLPVRYDAKAGKKGKIKSVKFALPVFDCPLLGLF